ncbi:hypothetical protein [Ochrobactrum soli]|uniref:Uncharacterized protein n=1 Tax=Ochrobactrum soli TaxID=2448455 RepID=A0A2P9HMJ3_9HYPH|nr:hypothetical protein [[Ochrobactrum] soli]SPL65331.1 hypothetical protein OHAE_1198 [[Ochrobactrum] soli]
MLEALLSVLAGALASLIRDLVKDWRYERTLKDLGAADAVSEISKQLQGKADVQRENDMADRGTASDVARRLRDRIGAAD